MTTTPPKPKPRWILETKQKSKAPQRKPRPYVPTRKSMMRPPHPNHTHPLFFGLFFLEKKPVFFATHSRFVLLPVPTFGNFSKFPKVGTGSAFGEQGGPYSGSTADWCAETVSAFEISTPIATHSRFVLLPVPTFGNFSKFPKVGTGSAFGEQGDPYSGSTADWCAETVSAFEISTPNF